MGWDHSEDESEDDRMGIEEINAICDAAANGPPPKPDSNREGIDWIRNEDGDLRRPLEHRSEEHTSELQSQSNLVCRLLLEKKKKKNEIFKSIKKKKKIYRK